MEHPTEYPKILTLFERNEDFTVDTSRLARPEFAQVRDWLVTEKVNGINICVALQKRQSWTDSLDHWEVGLYSRTNNDMPPSMRAYLEETFPVEKLLAVCRGDEPYPFVLYGEGYGPRIQKGGGNYRDNVSFRLFDVLVDGQWWLDWKDVCDVAAKLGIKTVPVIENVTPDSDRWMLTEAVELIERGESLLSQVARFEKGMWVPAEGIVARTDPYLFDKQGRRLVWKLKRRDFKAGRR